ALAYALYGDRLFSEYEQRFLKRDVQGALVSRALTPTYWPDYIGGSAGRSELAADYYDEILFEGATFGDLLNKHDVPLAIATSTDFTSGSRLAFFQQDFDLLCTNLNGFKLSRAAAASSAVPVVLSPVTLNNYGGKCNYQYQGWVKAVNDPKNPVRPSGRALQRYKEMVLFQDSTNRPYIHLVDGGVSDNIGVRGVMEALEELNASAEFQGQVGFGVVKNIVLMVVNSRSSPHADWDLEETPPGFVVQLLQSASVPIDRYSFETIETMKDRAEIMKWRRDLLLAEAQLAGQSKAQAEASIPKITMTVVDVSFDAIKDPKQKEYFMDLPTSFVLPAEDVDRLRDTAGQLMRLSPDYAEAVRIISNPPAK
ncbi:MAG: patatin-like phospholipase family protein, partial [Propionivibrio sp.]|nr:patatin-like phospholipase family protein [Propionivibrio sp.]